ncbi:MAG: hypothetical protein QM804_00635 [Propionicimonas sp.]
MSGHQSHATPTDLLVLHALRCIGFTSATTVVAATGLAEFEVESALIDLAVDGLVSHLEGPAGHARPAPPLTDESPGEDVGRAAGCLRRTSLWLAHKSRTLLPPGVR